ncbi:hypothetical protein [Amycolatopsis aidingensis]|uniref:hypothetical protein n=1 Tax=Amycolatopsis aidingensis TaxID=2842453 RepID=UPI001C0AD2A3|nr:hypothetical protein [Amycolatopsis aidingensis]
MAKRFAESIRQRAVPKDPDFVALGLGGTNMMALLWSIAMGKRCVGVELRGDPSLGVHWNLREDFFHHLSLIDRLMVQRHGEEGVPRRRDGEPFRLSEVFRSEETVAGEIFADEVIHSETPVGVHVSGFIHHTEFIDDRWVDGKPQRDIVVLDPLEPPKEYDPSRVGRTMIDVLDSPSTFQAGANEILVMLRRYLEMVEEMDLEAGVEPRVRLFLSHRVVAGDERANDGFVKWLRRDDGFVGLPDGRKRLIIEEIQEFDYKGKFRRVRKPGTEPIDLGTPEVFMIAQGFDSSDADRLGFKQEDVEVDNHDGKGPVVAQADYLAGFMELYVGARLRRRIASAFDSDGNEYWVRQLAVGHEDDPEVGWILVQVPDFKTFDPIIAGLVPPRTPRKSKRYIGAYQQLVRDYYLEQVALVTEIPKEELEQIQTSYGPKLFSLVERVGADAQVATNGVVAGDSFGNGHFLTSGGAVTGMVGHAYRMFQYWESREQGASAAQAIRELADSIRQDTLDWLQNSLQEFGQAAPINFGAERIAQISRTTGRDANVRATTIDAARRHRHSLVPLDPADWRRLSIRSGRLHTQGLPPLSETHPDLRCPARSGVEPRPLAQTSGAGATR